MMRKSLFVAVALLPFCSATHGAVVSVVSDGSTVLVPNLLDAFENTDPEAGKVGAINFTGAMEIPVGDGDIFTITGVSWDPDPVLTISFAFTDNGAPSTSGLFISNLLIDPPLDDWVQITSSGSMSVTDGGDGNVQVLTADPLPVPFANNDVFHFFANGTSVDLGVSVGPTPSANLVGGPNQSGVFGGFSNSNMLDSTGAPWNNAEIRVAFKGTGGGDIYTGNGSLTLEAKGHDPVIPEPTSVICWSLLAGIGLIASGRRRS